MRFWWHTQTTSVRRFSNASRTWHDRASTLVVAQDFDGTYGIGEATPLPGYSPDSLLDVEQWLHSTDATKWFIDASMPFDTVMNQLDAATAQAPPSASLAVQSALLDLWSKRRGSRLSAELRQAVCTAPHSHGDSNHMGEPLRVAPLLDVNAATFEQSFSAWLAQGFATFKVKIGANLAQEAQALHWANTIARSSDRPVTFRLDANQSLNANSLATTLALFARLPIEYIEEPCPLNQLTPTQPLPLPLALDESLHLDQSSLKSWLTPGRLAALVCKPMVAGSVRSVLSWHFESERLRCPLVLSHLFDGAVAFQLYLALAAALAPHTCHGLFPHSGLEIWSKWVTNSSAPGLGLILTPLALQSFDASLSRLH